MWKGKNLVPNFFGSILFPNILQFHELCSTPQISERIPFLFINGNSPPRRSSGSPWGRPCCCHRRSSPSCRGGAAAAAAAVAVAAGGAGVASWNATKTIFCFLKYIKSKFFQVFTFRKCMANTKKNLSSLFLNAKLNNPTSASDASWTMRERMVRRRKWRSRRRRSWRSLKLRRRRQRSPAIKYE